VTATVSLAARPSGGELFPSELRRTSTVYVPRDLAAGFLHELAAALRPEVSAASRRERLAGLLAVARHWEGANADE